jgi:hypothetical protein
MKLAYLAAVLAVSCLAAAQTSPTRGRVVWQVETGG